MELLFVINTNLIKKNSKIRGLVSMRFKDIFNFSIKIISIKKY